MLWAAFSVKVKATIVDGSTPSSIMRWIIRLVRVSVLPAPAPAMTLMYLDLDRTAFL
jgi:hypothetical protein